MAVPIVVVTPKVGFSELIGQLLSETGDYSLALASDQHSALEAVREHQPALLVLETVPNGSSMAELVAAARAEVPELRLVLIAPEDTPPDERFSGLNPDSLLVKPVYLPDLVARVEAALADVPADQLRPAPARVVEPFIETPSLAAEESAPDWLQDVNLAAQYLARLALESSSQASLITRADQIWAYAGELSRPAAEELARAVAAQFEDGGGSDLARFIRLDETGSEYMLYATGLGAEFVLAAVFDAEMPFSQIRSQASRLARALATPPPQEVAAELDPLPKEELAQVDRDDEEEDLVLDSWPLLEDVPPPIPADWAAESSLPKKPESLLRELLEDAQQDSFSQETVAVPSRALRQAQPEPQPETDENTEETAERRVRPAAPPEETVLSSSNFVPEFDQLPEPEHQIEVEPVSPSMYNLTYACVLIPRFPHHHLTGDIAKRLSDWITHLCVAFGWRLELLTIRPDFVQWLVNVPPNTSPGYLMRTIREHTSRRMFIEFPVMDKDNPSGDFWAPGYLILGSPQPPPAALIQEFMENTRSRQGLQEESGS